MTNPNFVASSPKHIPKAAPSRGLSPVRSPLCPPPMQPARTTSPVIRPRSPLSPRHDPASRFDPLMPPSSPRNMSTRTGINQRRSNNNHPLMLPTLPRFHPSNFPSPHNSLQPTPDSGHASPQLQPPASPRMHHRTISDAQKQLLAYQREMVSASVRSSTPVQIEGPESPRLLPLGSPGPVTPLQLEVEDGGYLLAGTGAAPSETFQSTELLEKLMREETARQRRSGSRQSNR